MNHEPEDLPDELTIVPSRAGEQARMKNRVQSSRSLSGLGDFLFERACSVYRCSGFSGFTVQRAGGRRVRSVGLC